MPDARHRDDGTCPFGPLYWHFMIRNRPLLEQINRVSRVYSNQDGMEQTKRADYLPSAGALVEAKEDCGRYFGVTDKWWRADIGLHLIKVRVALSE